jgi:N-acetylmuramoyl-L-alanine amidase
MSNAQNEPLATTFMSDLSTPESYLALKEQIEDQLDKIGLPAGASINPASAAKAGAKRLAIVVGHTKQASGAWGTKPIEASEYPWNSDLANRIVGVCEAAGLECQVFFRDQIGISGAYKEVENWKATACIELHFNASDDKARGTETLYGPTCPDSAAWAQTIQTTMVGLYGRTGKADRPLLKCPPYKRGIESVNALESIPSCLIEPFFGDNPADARLGHDYKQSLAQTLVKAFDSHFATLVPTSPTVMKSTVVADFENLILSIGLNHFTAEEILRPTYNTNGGVANSRPPKELWHNILPTIMVLDEIRKQAGVPISINSTYRSKPYNNSLSGAAKKSQHLDFRAIDFASSKMKPSSLAKIARKMVGMTFTIPIPTLQLLKDQAPLNVKGLKNISSGGVTTFEFHGGISEYNSFVHIDCRGDDVSWS